MSKFLVHVDVIFSGDVEVDASNESSAKSIAEGKTFLPSDLYNFYFLETNAVNVEKV